MKLHISHLSDVGRVRANNQDSCSVDLLDPRGNAALLIVADGMGGYEGGEIASQLAIETVRSRVLASAPDWAEKGWLGEGLTDAIHQANLAILQAQQESPSNDHMGTTLTAALIWGERIFLGHIGDSRAFFVGTNPRQLSTDHNVAWELVQSGHLTAEQAAVHPQRHMLTRALGMTELLVVERLEEPWAGPDILVLCSDGLSNLVKMSEVQQLAAETAPEELAGRLVALANERGGHDNITVLIARWEG